METKKIKENLGRWAFILGVILAIVAGMFQVTISGRIVTALIILGTLIGILNIQEKEKEAFLIASIALMMTGSAGFGDLPLIGEYIAPVFINIAVLVAPSAVIVALESIYELART